VPGGSGNSVMCDLGTWDLEEAARIIGEGKRAKMDVCTVRCGGEASGAGETIASVNTCIMGLIGDIGVLAESYRWMGPSRYENVAAIKLLCNYKQHIRMTLTYKDGTEVIKDDFFLTCFCNMTQFFGKGLRAAPFAKLDDGVFDLVCIKAGVQTRGELLAILKQAPSGAHYNNKNVESYTCSRAVFDFDKPGVFNVDGEVVKHSGQVVITCFQKHIDIFADVTKLAGGCKTK